MSSASLSVSASRLLPATSTYTRHADDYYDINDILASDSKVSCVFEMQVLRLGFLVPGTSVENIAVGTKMDLPYWLARALCSKRKQIVSVDIPKAYKDAYREVMRADANVVNLQKLGPYYYCTGVKLLNFELQETEALSRTLVEVSGSTACLMHQIHTTLFITVTIVLPVCGGMFAGLPQSLPKDHGLFPKLSQGGHVRPGDETG